MAGGFAHVDGRGDRPLRPVRAGGPAFLRWRAAEIDRHRVADQTLNQVSQLCGRTSVSVPRFGAGGRAPSATSLELGSARAAGAEQVGRPLGFAGARIDPGIHCKHRGPAHSTRSAGAGADAVWQPNRANADRSTHQRRPLFWAKWQLLPFRSVRSVEAVDRVAGSGGDRRSAFG